MFFVNSSILLLSLLIIGSCVPLKANKGALRFEVREIGISKVEENIPIEASFKSINKHFIEKSCLDCHNNNSPRLSFEGKQNLIDNADDILFYAEFGCDLGNCMPPVDRSGNPVKPIPTQEILKSLSDWVENDFEDIEKELEKDSEIDI
ncbi:MAG: hypothetical protein GY909_01565 [Oligoflexia bacterium]|nr:hypothetical protein [Oligoflexia bacterium]